MTDLENRAFAFIQVHTLYDECKGERYKDKADFELMAEFAQSQLAEKDKKIEELKESVTKFSGDGVAFLHSIKSNRNCIDCESKMSIQLTKAKEIIKDLLDILFINDCAMPSESKERAEQFLGE